MDRNDQKIPEDARFVAESIRNLLRNNTRAALVRDPEIESCLNRGGDVDILVESFGEIEDQILALLGAPVRRVERSYLRGLYYSWGHIDLLPRLEWRGADIVPGSVSRILEQTEDIDGYRVIRPAHRALHSWFSSILWGGFFKERYGDKISEWIAMDAECLRRDMGVVLGDNTALKWLEKFQNGERSVARKTVRKLRFRWRFRAFIREPFGFVRRWFQFVWKELKINTSPPVPVVRVYGQGCLDEAFRNRIAHAARSASFGAVAFREPGCSRSFVEWLRCRRLRAKGVLPIWLEQRTIADGMSVEAVVRGRRSVVKAGGKCPDGFDLALLLERWCKMVFYPDP